MCHSVLMGFLAGAVAMKMLHRWRRCHNGGGNSCGGNSCGGRFGRRFGGSGWRRAGGGWFRVIAALRGLDLNDRQRADAREVLGRIKESIADERARAFDDLIGAVGGETFDRARAESAIAAAPRVPEGARKEILDGLEHLHNILTPEQRAKLRDTLKGDSSDAPPKMDL